MVKVKCLVRELGLVVLLRQLLLTHIFPVLRGGVPLLEEGGEPHRVITGLNSLHSSIQSSVAGEEVRVGAFNRIERGTQLLRPALTLLHFTAKGASKFVPPTILELLFLTRGQRWFDDFNILCGDSNYGNYS